MICYGRVLFDKTHNVLNLIGMLKKRVRVGESVCLYMFCVCVRFFVLCFIAPFHFFLIINNLAVLFDFRAVKSVTNHLQMFIVFNVT